MKTDSLDPINLVPALLEKVRTLESQIVNQARQIPEETSNALRHLTAANDLNSSHIRALVECEEFISALLNDDYAMRILQSKGVLERPCTWVIGRKYQRMSGHTQSSLTAKRSTWQEGKHYTLAEDGNMYYNWAEIDQWVLNSKPKPKP